MEYAAHAAPFQLLDRGWDESDDVDEQFTPLDPFDMPELTELEAPSWFSNFELLQYNWDDPEFNARNVGRYAYRPVPLTKGYFMIVSPRDYERMTQFPDGSPKKWCANVQREPRTQEALRVYAYRSGRSGEPRVVYAHRELVGCLFDPGVVDHMNGWGLDNRRGMPAEPVNLRYTSQGENVHNAQRTRTLNTSLPRGAERRRKGKDGRQLFGGMYCKRSGKKVLTVRSRRVWSNPENAALWYAKQMQKLHAERTTWAHNPDSVQFPVFPPYHDVPF